jgi:hypothetical protein
MIPEIDLNRTTSNPFEVICFLYGFVDIIRRGGSYPAVIWRRGQQEVRESKIQTVARRKTHGPRKSCPERWRSKAMLTVE